jgi:hypothetical protein
MALRLTTLSQEYFEGIAAFANVRVRQAHFKAEGRTERCLRGALGKYRAFMLRT